MIVKGSTPEFDYPRGSNNVYRAYDGADGVPIGGFARRALYSWYFGDPNILLSQYVTAQSRIIFHRNIQERVNAIAPFLRLDKDPYIVVSGGRLYWIQDAYTTSSWFPYSQPIEGEATNYIRNSVKIVIDAYNGNVDFYLSDPADPIVETYRNIFPGLFKPFSEMPADLQKHTRYPEDLFLIQAQIYRAYHMGTPEVFYNREDLWQFPRQPDGVDETTTDSKMAPYYINMRLPGETHTEFVLMLPMVPSQRENMFAWLAARCDQPDYGKLIVYEFPKDKLVYGPYQIEALINQNTEVSQQLTLWNQSGSRVIRGNLLVVPIGNSILYVTPLYLRAQSGQLPELKRVIAIYGDRVVMEETLAGALAALFKLPSAAATPAPAAASAVSVGTGPQSDRGHEALAHYNRAIEKMKAGDWSGFGAELDALRPLLEQLNKPLHTLTRADVSRRPWATPEHLRGIGIAAIDRHTDAAAAEARKDVCAMARAIHPARDRALLGERGGVEVLRSIHLQNVFANGAIGPESPANHIRGNEAAVSVLMGEGRAMRHGLRTRARDVRQVWVGCKERRVGRKPRTFGLDAFSNQRLGRAFQAHGFASVAIMGRLIG